MLISIQNLDIFIISLDNAYERQEKIKNRLDRFNLKYTFFNAYKHAENIFSLNIICHVEGCTTSHIMLLKYLYDNKKKHKQNVLILEDDAFFCDDFLEAFNYICDNFQHKDFDILFLSSYYHTKKNFPHEWHRSYYNNTPIYINSPYFLDFTMNTYFLTSNKNINLAPGSFTTTSYIVNMKKIDKIFNTIYTNMLIYDPRIQVSKKCNPAIDMLYLLLGYYKMLDIYSVSPGIICQEDGYSFNSDTIVYQSHFFRDDVCGKHVFQNKFMNFDFYDYFKDNTFNYDLFQMIHENKEVSIDFLCNKNIYYYYHDNITKKNGKYIFTNWEEYYIYDLVKYLNINKNRIIIDVGANNGFFSIPIILDGYYTIMIEPIPSNIFAIEKSIEINHISSSKYIFSKCAVSSNNYSTMIYTPTDFTDNTSLSIDAALSNVKSGLEHYFIYCKKLDSIIFDNNLDFKDISFIKIDVQGFELPVLIGSLNLLLYSEELYIYLEKDIEMTQKAGFDYCDIEILLNTLGFNIVKNDTTNRRPGDILFFKDRKKVLSKEEYAKIYEIKNNTIKKINKHKIYFDYPFEYIKNQYMKFFLYNKYFEKYCDEYNNDVYSNITTNNDNSNITTNNDNSCTYNNKSSKNNLRKFRR